MGPQAAEVMASWQAPYKDPIAGGWGTMNGVWIAKKAPGKKAVKRPDTPS